MKSWLKNIHRTKFVYFLGMLFFFTLVYKVILLFKSKLNIDELFFLSNVYNHTLHHNMPAFQFSMTEIYRFDEIINLFHAPVGNGISNFLEDINYFIFHFFELTNHPPLSYLVAKIFLHIVPNDLLAIRLYSFISFLLTLPALYLLQKELEIKSRETRLLVLVIYSSLTLVSFTAYYAKGYAMQTLFLLCALLFYARSLRNDKPVRDLLLTFLFSILAFFTHYFSLPILFGLFLVFGTLEMFRGNEPKLSHFIFLVSYLFSSLGFYWLLQIQQRNTISPYPGMISWFDEFKHLASKLIYFFCFNFEAKWLTIMIMAFFFFLILFSRYKRQFRMLASLMLVPFMVIFLIDVVKDYHLIHSHRYLLVALPFVAMVNGILFGVGEGHSSEEDIPFHRKFLCLVILVPLLVTNMLFRDLQKFKSTMPISRKAITLARKESDRVQNHNVLYILLDYRAYKSTFIRYMEFYYDKRKTPKLERRNSFYTTAYAKLKDIKTAIRKNKIKEVVLLLNRKQDFDPEHEHLLALQKESGIDFRIEKI